MDHSGHEHALEILFHPILVHFPIAFFFLELLLIVLWMRKKDLAYHRFAYFSFKLGYAFMIAAMIAGYFDAGGWNQLFGMVKNHFLSAVTVFTIYSVRFIYWKRASINTPYYSRIQLAGAFLGNLAIAVAGYFGGEIVFG